MAKTPAHNGVDDVSMGPAVAQVHKDVASMQKIVDAEGGNLKFLLGLSLLFGESSKRKIRSGPECGQGYLQLENLREGMFWVAGELFDLQFKQITNVPVYHADVRVWEVSNKTTW
jgi:peptidyl-dipeptidase Dcp